MYRKIHQQLQSWYEDESRKPLVLKGARQVGKTFAVNSFGNEFVKNKMHGQYHYLDLKSETDLHPVFLEHKNPQKILEFIELKKKVKINPAKDLLFFDEIQDCPQAITSLKYFEQNLKPLHVIAAGSHLGLLKNEDSFPVGKVNFLSMFPMTFYEFLVAVNPSLCSYLDHFDVERPEIIPDMIHQELMKHLIQYFAVGGAPEAVKKFCDHIHDNLSEAFFAARKVQKELIIGYESDFSKYSGTVNANHIHHVFRSLSTQLAKSHDESVAKFKFSGVIPNQKGFERIIGPLTWLSKSRLCIKSFIAKKSGHPLLSYTEENTFKVFYFDIGLLNATLETPIEAIIKNDLSSYKGYMVENFVAQELYAIFDRDLISWQEGQAEVEFLMTKAEHIIPLEVKSGTKSRRAKSLDSYVKKYSPQMAYKISAQNVGVSSERFTTLPLYLCSKIFE